MDNYTFDIYIYSTFFGVDTIIENVGYVLYLINIMGGMITPFLGGGVETRKDSFCTLLSPVWSIGACFWRYVIYF